MATQALSEHDGPDAAGPAEAGAPGDGPDENTAPPQRAPDTALLGPAYRTAEWLWLGLCTAIGGAFRAVNLDGRPLWADELTTIITVRRPLAESFTTGQDPQPPLHQLLLRSLSGGDPNPSEAVLRTPACVFGIASIAAAWWCARHFIGRAGAAVVALLVAFNPMLIHHARDARPYSLYVFFAALSVTFFYRLVRRGGWGNAVGYALTTAGVFQSHYYAMFFIAAHVAYAAADCLFAGSSRRHMKHIAAGLVGAVVLASPVLYMFLQLLTGGMRGSWWISPPHGVIHGFDALGDMLGVRALGVLCIIPLLAAFWWNRSAVNSRSNRRPTARLGDWTQWWTGKERAIYLASIIGFVLFLPLVGSLLVKPGWIERYSLPVVVPMLILGVAFLRSVGPAVTVMVLGLLLLFSAPKAMSEMKGEPGLRDAVAVVKEHMAAGDAVMLPDWPFADDYINPDKVGVAYYGLEAEPRLVPVAELDAFVYGKSNTLSAQRVAEIGANPDQLLPPGRTWAICFHSTAKPLRQFLIKRGRTFEEWHFGLYDDGRTPMYTLMRIDPRR